MCELCDNVELQAALNAAQDRIAELETSLDSVTQTHLEEQQRWGIERERLTRYHKAEVEAFRESVDYWISESRAWATKFAEYRQQSEHYVARLKKRVGSWRFMWFVMFVVATLWALAWALK